MSEFDKKIEELDAAGTLDGTEKIPAEQGGETVYIEFSQFATDITGKQDINARSTLYTPVTTLDAGINYTLQATDKNTFFTWTLTAGRNFVIPAGLSTSGSENHLNVGASFFLNNRSGSAASITVDAGAVTFEGSTTVTAGTTIEIKRIATNIYIRK